MSVDTMGVSIGMSGLIGIGTYAMNYRNRVRTEANTSGFAYIVSARKAGLLSNAKKAIELL